MPTVATKLCETCKVNELGRLCPSCHKDFDLQKDTLIKDII